MKLLVVVEPTDTGYSAYLPDLPGCVATGATRREVQATIRSAAAFHMEGLIDLGRPLAKPLTYATYVDVRERNRLRRK